MREKTAIILVVGLVLFFAPFNLFVKFFENAAYVHGLFVDYLLVKWYVVDLVLTITLGLVVTKYTALKNISPPWWFVGLFLIFLIRQFFSTNPLASMWYVGVLVFTVGWGAYLIQNRPKFSAHFLLTVLGLTIIFQSWLGLYQFFSQKSLAPYYILGETQLTRPLGLHKGSFAFHTKVLPYGTTPHPNILGGFLSLYFLLWLKVFLKTPAKATNQKNILKLSGLILTVSTFTTLFLTQSLSAWLTLVLGLVALAGEKNLRKLKITHGLALFTLAIIVASPFILHYFSQLNQSLSLLRRDVLNQAAFQIWLLNPVFGVGLNNFTVHVEKVANSNEIVRFVQPVHHLGLLWLAETGLLGLFLIGWLLKKSLTFTYQTKSKLVLAISILLPLIVLDHYLLTQHAGLLLFSTFLTLNVLE